MFAAGLDSMFKIAIYELFRCNKPLFYLNYSQVTGLPTKLKDRYDSRRSLYHALISKGYLISILNRGVPILNN